MLSAKYKSQESILRFVLVLLLNSKTYITRRYLCGAAHIRMHKRLARKLVDKGEWYMICLYSGTQVPIFNAIEYLGAIKDHDSIHRLKELYKKYSCVQEKNDRSFQGESFSITYMYGPANYVPQDIQTAIVKALLKILPADEAEKFIKKNLNINTIKYLSDRTISVFAEYTIKNKLRSITSLMLETAYQLEKIINNNTEIVGSKNPYGCEDLLYAVYQVSNNFGEKEGALKLLISEYNHPGAKMLHESGTGRTHCHIDFIMCEIVEKILAGKLEEKERVISQLNPDRLERDLKRFKEYCER